jgi:hypothetical protein
VTPLGPKTREWGTIGTLVFCHAVIGGLLVWGNPQNGLHMAALPNAFWVIVAVLAALGAPVLAEALKPKV